MLTLPLHPESSISELNTTRSISLINLLEAITHVAGSKAELQAQLTTTLAKDKGHDGMDASHLPPSPVDWSHVTGILPLIGHYVQSLKGQFLVLDESVVQVSVKEFIV